MTEHDRIRMERAATCDRDDPESLLDALVGLQSTDDPALTQLYDDLDRRYKELRDRQPAPISL